jgi:hypothetical protein
MVRGAFDPSPASQPVATRIIRLTRAVFLEENCARSVDATTTD